MNYSLGIKSLSHSFQIPKFENMVKHPSQGLGSSNPIHVSGTDALSLLHDKANSNLSIEISSPGIHKIDSSFDQDVVENLDIVVSAKTKTTIVIFDRGSAFHSQRISLQVEPESVVDLIILQNKQSGNSISLLDCSLEKDSKLTTFNLDMGSDKSYLRIRNRINGENAKINALQLVLKSKAQESDLDIASIHNVGCGKSQIDTALVLKDHAKSIARCLVDMGTEAFDSEGYEIQNALLLSDGCRVRTIPDLLIHNNEVSCSHSSSVHRLDENVKFYIQSRGLNSLETEKLMTDAFINNTVEKIGNSVAEKIVLGEIFE